MRGVISDEAWQKGLEETRKRELEAAERAKANPGQLIIATKYNDMADGAERERLADLAGEESKSRQHLIECYINRLSCIPPLSKGSHKNLQDGACMMEAVSFVAGEAWSDAPECTCPVITWLLDVWNDDLDDEDRDKLLRPLIPLVIGTRASSSVEKCRATMAVDWLIREHAPAWLCSAGMTALAEALAALPEITDTAQAPSPLPGLIRAAAEEAATTWGIAWNPKWAEAENVPHRYRIREEAWIAAQAAAGPAYRASGANAVWDAAQPTVWDGAGPAIYDGDWDIAGNPAWDAARIAVAVAIQAAALSAGRGPLKPTTETLQKSVLMLVLRMIEAGRREPGSLRQV